MSTEAAARVAGILEAYDAQGWHRTGTNVDAESASWFTRTLTEMGAEAVLDEFRFDRVEVGAASLEVGGRTIHGLPLFDAPDPPDGLVVGALGPLGSAAPIGLTITRSPAPDPGHDALRRDGQHQAIVAVTVGRAPGLQARNAGNFNEPFGLPFLQVGSEHQATLESAAAALSPVTLEIQTRRIPAKSANISVRVPGANPALRPLVVSTPRTGWWNCSGERGGGIACWFEILRSALAEPYLRDAIFVAFAGHELDFLGVQEYLKSRPGLPARAHAWVHFGANVGAAAGASIRVSASRSEDLAAAREALEAEDLAPVTSPDAGTVLGGESSVVARLGARCVALLGGNDLFHIESDRWPANNDVPRIVRQATAFSGLTRRLAAEPGDR